MKKINDKHKNSLHLLEKQSEHICKIWTAIDKVVQFPDFINETGYTSDHLWEVWS